MDISTVYVLVYYDDAADAPRMRRISVEGLHEAVPLPASLETHLRRFETGYWIALCTGAGFHSVIGVYKEAEPWQEITTLLTHPPDISDELAEEAEPAAVVLARIQVNAQHCLAVFNMINTKTSPAPGFHVMAAPKR